MESPGAHKVLFESSEHLWQVWGLILNTILPLLPSCWGFSFVFGCGVSFFGGIQHSPVDGCSAASCNFGVLAGELALSNSMKLWAMLCSVAQDRWVMVENSDKMWSTGEGTGKPLQYSCLEDPMNSMKRQKHMTLKAELPDWWVPNMLLEISGEVTPKRMKGWSQSKNSTQLWLPLVIEARSDAVRAILHRNLECQVHESKQIGSGQTRDGKGERPHSRNQRTKMDWNGWI